MATPPLIDGADALLLDLYDTIVWTEWPVVLDRLGGHLGVDAATLVRGLDATQEQRGTGRCGSVAGDLGALARACGLDLSEPVLATLATTVVADAQGLITLYDDVLPAVRGLRADGVRVALVSNCDHATRPLVDALALESEMDAVVLSCEVGSLKPQARIFEEALRRLGAAPGNSLFVDDQTAFLDGAAALGIRTARMARPWTRSRPARVGAHPVISSLEDLRRPARAGRED